MSKQIQLRRGTLAEHETFTGALGEVTVVTDDFSLRVHDGVTPGGNVVAGGVIGGGGGTTTISGITLVSNIPETGTEGDIVFNTTDQVMYTYVGGQWVDVKTALAMPDGIEVVSVLPTVDNYENRTVFLTTDNKLYKYVNGVWTAVVQAVEVAQEVADGSITTAKFAQGITPVEVVGVLPTEDNFTGRVVVLTTDNKLYRFNGTGWTAAVATGDLTGTIGSYQLAANSVIAGKIAAGAISATEIAAGAISTDKLAAGVITSDKISANAITATNIAAGAITSGKLAANAVLAGNIQAGAIGTTHLAASVITTDKLAANAVYAGNIAAGAIGTTQLAAGAITADKIATGAITANKISAGTTTIASGQIFGLGQGANAFGLPGTIVANTTASAIGILSVGGSTSYEGLSACAVNCTPTHGKYAFAAGNALSTAYNSWRTAGQIGAADIAALFAHYATTYVTHICSGSYGIYTSGPIGPFTGQHDALLDKATTITPGDIIVDTGYALSVSVMDTITKVAISSSANQKGVVGVYSKDAHSSHVPVALADDMLKTPVQIKSEHLPLLATNKLILINSLGEGLINVCGEGGNLEVGDLIVSSSLPGKGMKQSDDVVRSITVAKVREAVTFSSPTEVKQVACIYLAG